MNYIKTDDRKERGGDGMRRDEEEKRKREREDFNEISGEMLRNGFRLFRRRTRDAQLNSSYAGIRWGKWLG